MEVNFKIKWGIEVFRFSCARKWGLNGVEKVTSRIRCGWTKWEEVTEVLYGKKKKMSLKVKGKLYKTIMKPMMTYGSEC